MSLKLYFDLMSQPSRAVFIFLKLNNIQFEPKPVALRKGEHLSETYKKINPLGLVPVIDDNGFILTESCAILKYLTCKYDIKEHWYPRSNLRETAKVDEFIHWQHIALRMQTAMVFQNLVLIPRAQQKPINWKQYNNFKARSATAIHNLDTVFLKNKPYLCGDDVSIADLLAVCELMQLYACCEEELYKNNKNVDAWVNRVQQRLEPAFSESMKVVNLVRKHFPALKEEFSKL